MSEKMRDDFHEWCRSIGFTLKMNACGNDYAMGYGWEQWQAWQASRAAMVVELPELKSFNASDEPDFAYEVAIDDIKCALDDAGVGYK